MFRTAVPSARGILQARLSDYSSEKVHPWVLLAVKADLLVYRNGERHICEIAQRRVAAGGLTETPLRFQVATQ